jgi:hypothetical protein
VYHLYVNTHCRRFSSDLLSLSVTSNRINQVTKETLVDENLFPLHSPKNYCDWMGESTDRVKYVWQNA